MPSRRSSSYKKVGVTAAAKKSSVYEEYYEDMCEEAEDVDMGGLFGGGAEDSEDRIDTNKDAATKKLEAADKVRKAQEAKEAEGAGAS